MHRPALAASVLIDQNGADGWLEEVGLEGLGERRPDQLSGRQQQRVVVARTLPPAGGAIRLRDESRPRSR